MQADFEGFYARFDTMTKKDSGIVMGADTLVGDEYTYKIEMGPEGSRTLLFNKFDYNIGYFSEQPTRQIQLMEARGWTVKILLAFVAYSDHPDPGEYWGQMAVLGYPKECEELFAPFVKYISQKLADGVRINVNIGVQGVKNLVESNGTWQTKDTLPAVKFEKGTVMMKNHRTFSENMVEQGRKGNKGCYAVSWLFIIILVALVIFALHAFGLF